MPRRSEALRPPLPRLIHTDAVAIMAMQFFRFTIAKPFRALIVGPRDGRPMKLFQCQNCGQPLYFENIVCESCGLALGYLAARETVTALRPDAKYVQQPNAPPVCASLC